VELIGEAPALIVIMTGFVPSATNLGDAIMRYHDSAPIQLLVVMAAIAVSTVAWAAPVVLVNAGFEDPAGPKTVGDSTWSNIPGWTSTGPSADSGIELFTPGPQPLLGANIAFLQSGDGSIFQTTTHSIVANDKYFQLSFYERNDYNATELTASLYYQNGATRVPFASQTFMPLTNNGRAGPLTQRVLYGEVPAQGIGQLVGVEFVNGSNAGATGTWAWVDGVALETNGGPGDVNTDGLVNPTDFGIISGNFYNTPATRAEGDITFDGTVNFADFRLWKNNTTFGNGSVTTSPSVPEPASALLLGVAAALGTVTVFLRAMSRASKNANYG
jgi:HpiC1 cyclase/Dockerin type I domain